MRRIEFSASSVRARVAAAALVVAALAGSLIPASHARQETGRPRRVSTPERTSAAAQQQRTPTPTPTPRPAPPPGPAVTTQDEPPPAPAPPKLRAQPTAEPDAPQQDEAGQEVEGEEPIRIDANLVTLHVRVVDRNNHPINDVANSDFKVFENGAPQDVQFVTREEVPITYGLVVDNSGSLRNQIGQVVEAAKTIVESNKAGDETFVVRFISSDEIKIMQDFTADKQAIGDALDDMFIEGGQTAVIDAAYLAAEHASERRKKTGDPVEDKRRRALIIVTDGEDRNSFYKQEQLFESLKESDVQIYVIGFVNELEKERGFISKSKRDKAVSLLDRMARETGGRTFYPTSLSELPGIAEQITKDLRTQYVISYKPAAKNVRPGEFRPVRVAVADGRGGERRIAVTRSGYTAKPQQPAPQPAPPSKANVTPAGRRP
jgi:Ca-activated chloride channel homolog